MHVSEDGVSKKKDSCASCLLYRLSTILRFAVLIKRKGFMRYNSIYFLCLFSCSYVTAMELLSLQSAAARAVLAVQDAKLLEAQKMDFQLGYEYCMSNWDKAWRLLMQRTILTSPHQKTVLSSVFIRNSKRAVTVGIEGNICIWNLESKELEYCKKLHEKKIESVAISSDQRFIATASADGTAVLWALKVQNDENSSTRYTLESLQTLDHGELVTAVALSYHQTDLQANGAVFQTRASYQNFASGYPEIVTGSASGKVRTFCGKSGACLAVYDQWSGVPPQWNAEIRCVSFSLDNTFIYAGSTDSVGKWKRSSGIRENVDVGDVGDATSMTLIPGGCLWGTLFGDVGIASQKGIIKKKISETGINAVSLSADGGLFAAGNLTAIGSCPKVFLCSLTENGCELLRELEGPQLFISTIVVSPDKGDILIGDGTGVCTVYSIRGLAEKLGLSQARFVLDMIPRLVCSGVIDLRSNIDAAALFTSLHRDVQHALRSVYTILLPGNE